MRRTSVSLPTKQVAHDPHEKPARYNDQRNPGLAAGLISVMVSQAQKSRWLKVGGIVLTIWLLFYWLAPMGGTSTQEFYQGGMELSEIVFVEMPRYLTD